MFQIIKAELKQWLNGHTNSMCACQVISIQNLCHTWVILITTHFLYPNIGVSACIF